MRYIDKQFVQVIIFTIIFCLSAGYELFAYETEIKKLSATMAEKIAEAEKNKVAVVDFTDLQGNVTELGRFIAEEFSSALSKTGKEFTVVDRVHLNVIVKEKKLSATGLIDSHAAMKLGKIQGVEALITGTLTPFGDSVRIVVKVLDSFTAGVIGSNEGNIAKTKVIEELLSRGIAGGGSSIPVILKAENKGFIFALQNCKKSGQGVTCSLLTTSKDQDKRLRIYRWRNDERTRIIDNLGNECISKQVQLGQESTTGRYLRNLLVAGVPTKTIITFDCVTPEATTIALLEISCEVEDNDFRIQLRGVPFSK